MSENPFSLWVYLSQSPLLWLTVTLLIYAVAGVVAGIAMSLNALVTSLLVPLAVTLLVR